MFITINKFGFRWLKFQISKDILLNKLHVDKIFHYACLGTEQFIAGEEFYLKRLIYQNKF